MTWTEWIEMLPGLYKLWLVLNLFMIWVLTLVWMLVPVLIKFFEWWKEF